MAALRDIPEEPEGEYASPQLSLLKKEAAEARKSYREVGERYIAKFGYDEALPEMAEIQLTEKQEKYVEAYEQFRKCEEDYYAKAEEMRRILADPQQHLLRNSDLGVLQPFFREALIEEYGDVIKSSIIQLKRSVSASYRSFRDAEQKLRSLTRPEDRGEERSTPS